MHEELRGTVIALGTFDGVHRGHAALIEQTRALAAELGAKPLIYTFENHPLTLFGQEPKLLMTARERLAALAGLGCAVAADAFDAQLAAMTPADFTQMLLRRFDMRGAVAGFNYTFGAKGRGDTALLESLGREQGFAVCAVPPVLAGGAPVSSSRIRALLEAGDVAGAAAMLGRRYALAGRIVGNRHIGRELGFPTANLSDYGEKVLPESGVYATLAHAGGRTFHAVTNVGSNPTVEGRVTTVETHLLDFSGDLYGEALRVEFVERLRGEIRFPDCAALAAQIASDAERAREILRNQAK